MRKKTPPRGFRTEVTWRGSSILKNWSCNINKWVRGHVTLAIALYHWFLLFIAVARNLSLGYRLARNAPPAPWCQLCRHCLCAPCVIEKPPDFLRRSCGPHPANTEKRHVLYRKFWRCLEGLECVAGRGIPPTKGALPGMTRWTHACLRD